MSSCEKEPVGGYRTEKANKSIDAGIDEVRKRLEPDDSDRPGLLVSDNCEHLIQEFLGYKEEQVGTTQADDHCLDCTRYACMGEVDPKLQGGVFDVTDAFEGPKT